MSRDHLKFKQLEDAALAAWKPVRKGFDNLKPAARDFGKALIALRAGLRKRGDFMAWLRKHKIDENRSMYCLRLVQGKVKTVAKPSNQPLDADARWRQVDSLVSKLYGELRQSSAPPRFAPLRSAYATCFYK